MEIGQSFRHKSDWKKKQFSDVLQNLPVWISILWSGPKIDDTTYILVWFNNSMSKNQCYEKSQITRLLYNSKSMDSVLSAEICIKLNPWKKTNFESWVSSVFKKLKLLASLVRIWIQIRIHWFSGATQIPKFTKLLILENSFWNLQFQIFIFV